MKKLIGVIALFTIISLTACNRNGCPNKLDVEDTEVEVVIE